VLVEHFFSFVVVVVDYIAVVDDYTVAVVAVVVAPVAAFVVVDSFSFPNFANA
jgi:hypothetical protein